LKRVHGDLHPKTGATKLTLKTTKRAGKKSVQGNPNKNNTTNKKYVELKNPGLTSNKIQRESSSQNLPLRPPECSKSTLFLLDKIRQMILRFVPEESMSGSSLVPFCGVYVDYRLTGQNISPESYQEESPRALPNVNRHLRTMNQQEHTRQFCRLGEEIDVLFPKVSFSVVVLSHTFDFRKFRCTS